MDSEFRRLNDELRRALSGGDAEAGREVVGRARTRLQDVKENAAQCVAQ